MSKELHRKRMSIFSWWTLEIFTTVGVQGMVMVSAFMQVSGTGLSDGYPPGGVDAHEVCSNHNVYSNCSWYLRVRSRTSSLNVSHMISWPSASKHFFPHPGCISNPVFSHELYVYANTYDM